MASWRPEAIFFYYSCRLSTDSSLRAGWNHYMSMEYFSMEDLIARLQESEEKIRHLLVRL
jgi:hypothetical protein